MGNENAFIFGTAFSECRGDDGVGSSCAVLDPSEMSGQRAQWHAQAYNPDLGARERNITN